MRCFSRFWSLGDFTRSFSNIVVGFCFVGESFEGGLGDLGFFEEEKGKVLDLSGWGFLEVCCCVF